MWPTDNPPHQPSSQNRQPPPAALSLLSATAQRGRQALLCIMALVVGLHLSAYAALRPQDKAATVLAVSGQAFAKQTQGKARVLKYQSDVFVGDSITTEANAEVKLRFLDNTTVQLKPRSLFEIDDYVFSKNNPSKDHFFVSLLKGGLRTVTGWLSKRSPEGYQIKTPVATVAVRGTDYTLLLDEKGALYTAVWEGRIILNNQFGKMEVGQGGHALSPYAKVPAIDVAPQPLPQLPAALRACGCAPPSPRLAAIQRVNAPAQAPEPDVTPTEAVHTPTIRVSPVRPYALGRQVPFEAPQTADQNLCVGMPNFSRGQYYVEITHTAPFPFLALQRQGGQQALPYEVYWNGRQGMEGARRLRLGIKMLFDGADIARFDCGGIGRYNANLSVRIPSFDVIKGDYQDTLTLIVSLP